MLVQSSLMNSCSRRLVSPARPLCSSELAGCLPETRRHRQQQQSARALSFSGSDTLCCWESTAACSTAALARPTCSVASSHPASGAFRRQVTRMGNGATGGPFAPIVVVVRDVVGKKEFNKLRGKAISLHSGVIKDFGKYIGADNKQVQGLIRTAKKNGERLGFLA